MKSRSRWKNGDLPFRAIALFTLVGILALGPGAGLPSSARSTLILASSLLILSAYACIVLKVVRYRRRRSAAWSQVVDAVRLVDAQENPRREPLNDVSLTYLAQHVYSKMGYQVTGMEKHWQQGVYLKLVSPREEVELVRCLCSEKPLSTRQLCDLDNKMIAEKAIHGSVWAPGGFTQNALEWYSGKPVSLLNIHDIQRLIATVRASAVSR